jgi:hypothetical protein
MIMGKVVGSSGYRVSCSHAYTIFFGAPIIFSTPNIADNRDVQILVVRATPKKWPWTGVNPLRQMHGRFNARQCRTYAGLRAGSTTSQAREYVGTIAITS